MNCPKCGDKIVAKTDIFVRFGCWSVLHKERGFTRSQDCLTAENSNLKDKLKVAGEGLILLAGVRDDIISTMLAAKIPGWQKVDSAFRAAKQFLNENPELKGGKEG